jgi:hypothetical protein
MRKVVKRTANAIMIYAPGYVAWIYILLIPAVVLVAKYFKSISKTLQFSKPLQFKWV